MAQLGEIALSTAETHVTFRDRFAVVRDFSLTQGLRLRRRPWAKFRVAVGDQGAGNLQFLQ